MGVVSHLLTFGLAQAFGDGVESLIDLAGERFTDHSRALARALADANERAWQALEIALAGDSWWDRVKGLLGRREDQALAGQVRAFLDAAPLPELTGSTFTLNNVGSFGGSSGTPIINYPEAAILAVGRLQEKAIVRDGTILARPMMPLALSFDHRLIDGALAGKFLARFKALVENPQQLMLDMI